LSEPEVRIAQIAPIIEDVPPRLYGGTERIVSYLTEELVALGHDVTLFASGRSVTSATLVPSVSEGLRFNASVIDALPYCMTMLDQVRERAEEFDILHFHIDVLHYPIFRPFAERVVTTLHGRQDLADLRPLRCVFSDMPLVAISKHQRLLIPEANVIGVVQHGLPPSLLAPTLTEQPSYLAFLGRISPEKRPDRAIAIAQAAGLPLRIAAKVDRVDDEYFREVIRPLLGGNAEYIGEIGEDQKARFLSGAKALLFPIDWPEPFGLVMIEAMACGTPVVAFKRGSVPEVIEDGLTGAVVENIDEAVAALPRVLRLDRTAIRRRFEERFAANRMAQQYIAIYQILITRQTRRLFDRLNGSQVPLTAAAQELRDVVRPTGKGMD
jgi:glycosyltransferase involved in cell wall biosynthesis